MIVKPTNRRPSGTVVVIYSSILGMTNQRSSPVFGPMSLQADVN